MKRILSLLLAVVMMFAIAGCAKKTDTATKNDTSNTEAVNAEAPKTDTTSEDTADKEPVELDIFQYKVEIVEQLDALIADFEKEYPYIQVEIDTVGGGQNYSEALKARVNSGSEPDILNVGGPTELVNWLDYLEPLTDQPWVANAFAGTLDMLTVDGEVYGQPYAVEGYGLIYNKDMFKQAGIDAGKITTLSALKDAFATLDSKKAELGIDKVLSFSVGDSAAWTAHVHSFNVALARQEDPIGFINQLNEGTATFSGNDRMEAWLDLLDLYFQYSYDDLMTVSYDDQYGNFALGKTAVLHQGNWTINQINEITPDMNIAFLPISLNDDPTWKNDTIPVGVPNFWCVNKNSSDAKKEAAKLFLDYIASTERGATFLVDECKFIPAFKNITKQANDPLSASIQEYSKAGKTVPWVWMYTPDGFIDPAVKEAIQKYYIGDFNKEQMLSFLDEQYQSLIKGQ